MASLRKRGERWFIRYVNGAGQKVEVRGATDKQATKAIAAGLEAQAAKERAGLSDPRESAYAKAEQRPLLAHLQDYLAILTAKGGTTQHVRMTASRIEKVLSYAGAHRISELTLSRVQSALPKLREEKLGLETINHHIRGVKAFARWLWRDSRCREHPLNGLSILNSSPDKRRVRRALTPEECGRLIEITRVSQVVYRGLTGPDRAMLYELAVGTGFRARELGSLTHESFNLDAGMVTVEAGYSKHRKRDVQPLAPELVEKLRTYLAHRPVGKPVFKIPDHRTATMIRLDLQAAEIPYLTQSGYFDFHAWRTTYISRVVETGTDVKTAMTLARHSTPVLTIGVYAKADPAELRRTVERMAGSAASGSEQPAADLAHHLPTGVVADGRMLSDSEAEMKKDEALMPRLKPLESNDLSSAGGSIREVRKMGRAGIEPATPGFSGEQANLYAYLGSC